LDIDAQPRQMGECDDVNLVDIGADEVFYPNCWNHPTQCHGDSDGDGDVDTVDWPPFRDGFGSSYPDPNYLAHLCADYDRDGDIDTVDWPQFRDNFGSSPDANCQCGGTWPPAQGLQGGGASLQLSESESLTAEAELLYDIILWLDETQLPGYEDFIDKLLGE
jgi:hypothetical protein